jgi:hypothetical protein
MSDNIIQSILVDTDNTSQPVRDYFPKHRITNDNSIPIVGKNYKTGEIKHFKSMAAASLYTDISKKGIRDVVNKKEVKLRKDWFFVYVSENITWPDL